MKILKIFVLIVATLFLCVGCKFDLKEDVYDNISEIRYNLYVGENAYFKANFSSGMRENPYSFDGISNSKCEFGVLSVDFKNLENKNQIAYSLTVDSIQANGYLEENPFDHTFMVDIEKLIETKNNIILKIEGFDNDIILSPISQEWQTTYSDVLDLILSKYEENFNIFVKNNKFNAECYLKIIYDKTNAQNPYFWHFSAIGTDGTKISFIVDVNSGEIISNL